MPFRVSLWTGKMMCCRKRVASHLLQVHHKCAAWHKAVCSPAPCLNQSQRWMLEVRSEIQGSEESGWREGAELTRVIVNQGSRPLRASAAGCFSFIRLLWSGRSVSKAAWTISREQMVPRLSPAVPPPLLHSWLGDVMERGNIFFRQRWSLSELVSVKWKQKTPGPCVCSCHVTPLAKWNVKFRSGGDASRLALQKAFRATLMPSTRSAALKFAFILFSFQNLSVKIGFTPSQNLLV